MKEILIMKKPIKEWNYKDSVMFVVKDKLELERRIENSENIEKLKIDDAIAKNNLQLVEYKKYLNALALYEDEKIVVKEYLKFSYHYPDLNFYEDIKILKNFLEADIFLLEKAKNNGFENVLYRPYEDYFGDDAVYVYND